jgi:NADH-quinone oxidoreductase subunit J
MNIINIMNINIASMLFYVLASMLCICAIQTLITKNPVHAALFLILSFFSTSGLFIIQGAEFLALILILVYVGAVMVLFLFVVMMIDTKHIDEFRTNFYSYIPMASTIGLLFLAQIVYILFKSDLLDNSSDGKNSSNDMSNNAMINILNTNSTTNTKELGKLIFSEYLIAFEVVGCILLVAILIAVVLTIRSRKDTKVLSVSRQVEVNAKDRIILVDSKIKP